MSDDKKMSDLINEINQYDIGIVINNVGLPGGGKYM
jgi:short-subunit dehydrogenase